MQEELKEEIEKVEEEMAEEGEKEGKVNSETVLVDAYEKLRKSEKLLNGERRALEVLADKFCMCSLDKEKVGEKVGKEKETP